MRWFNFLHIYQPPAWDEAIIRRVAEESYQPILSILERHPGVRVTMNITGALSEQLQALNLGQVLERFRKLVERQQVELVGSAMYHPILPLLPIDEVRRQIELQQDFHRQIFGSGWRPRGFYCPEMAYSSDLDNALIDLGYEWVILDEICATGAIGKLPTNRHYVTRGGLKVVFRNRHISDYLSFSSDLSNPADSLRAISEDARSNDSLISAMDGENLGHHRHGVDQLWEFLVTYPKIETGTISSFINDTPSTSLNPLAGSWSSSESDIASHIPFALWNHPDNPIHRLQWELTYTVIEIVEHSASDPGQSSARRLLDRALASDRYWWASASPWWDTAIIIRETQKLADVIGPLEGLTGSKKNIVERLMQQIVTTVQLWDRTGLAKKRQQSYLDTTGAVHYLGGAQI